MTISRKKVKDTRKRVLRTAEELLTQRVSEHTVEELTQVGIVWSGILNADTPIPPSEVAAMLAAHDLIKATRFVDSEEYWTSAAAYAALGAYAEPGEELEETPEDVSSEPSPIGFAPGHNRLQGG